MALKESSPAPDFSLPANDGQTYKLSELRGQVVVLNFYPGDDTAVCTQQLCSYSEKWDSFGETDAVVLGISPQDLESHGRFAAKYDLKIPLLYDEGFKVAKSYGLGKLGGWRATFVIDQQGIIRWVFNSMTALRYANSDEILARIGELG